MTLLRKRLVGVAFGVLAAFVAAGADAAGIGGSGLSGPPGGIAPDASNAQLPAATRNMGLMYTALTADQLYSRLADIGTNGGGSLIVKAGIYNLTRTVQIPSYTYLHCDAGAVFKYNDTGSGWFAPGGGGVKLAFVNAHYTDAAMTAGTPTIRDSHIEIEGCTFIADGTTRTAMHDILFRDVDHIRIHHNFFKNAADATAMLNSTDTDIHDNAFGVTRTGTSHTSSTIDGMSSAVDIDVGDLVSGPGVPAATYVAAISSTVPGASSVTLTQDTTSGVTGTFAFGPSSNACWDHWEGVSQFFVHNNVCASNLYGVLVTGSPAFGSTVYTSHDGIVVDNSFTMVGSLGKIGIWLNGVNAVGNGVSRAIVRGNTVVGDGVDGSGCWEVSGASDSNTVNDNKCDNTGTAVISNSSSGNDAAGTPSTTMISGNTYTNNPNAPAVGVIVDLGSGSVIKNERVVGGNYPYAIWESGVNSWIVSNLFDVGTSGYYNTSGSTNPNIVDIHNFTGVYSGPSNVVANGATQLSVATTGITATPVILPTAGIGPVVGQSTTCRTAATGNSPASPVAGEYTSQTPVTTEFYYSQVLMPANCTATGVAVYNSGTISGNFKVGLAKSDGTIVATSSSTAMSGTGFQRVPFTAQYAITGPASFYVLVFYDNATVRPNTFTVGGFSAGKVTSQTYSTGFTNFTPNTVFTAGVGPVASLY